MNEISTRVVKRKLMNKETLNMIDVRETDEVNQGIIPGAQHMPLGEVSDRLNELDKSKQYIMICRSGGRSEKATQFLLSQGFKAKNMVEGMVDWSGPTEIPPYT